MEEKPDFRNTSWGMNKEQVKTIEKTALISERIHKEDVDFSYLTYKDNAFGFDIEVLYTFIKNRFLTGLYFFKKAHILDFDLYVDDFFQIEKALVQEYREPIIKQKIIGKYSDKYIDDYKFDLNEKDQKFDMVNLLMKELYSFVSKWEINNSQITLTIEKNWDTNKPEIKLQYEPIKEPEIKSIDSK